MLYDVEEVASKLNVSKQTIYSKLKLKMFKDKVLIKQGKSYIDDDLFNLNKDLINTLIEQLKEKDSQIHQLHKLIENNQVLLKEKSQKDLLQLEEHFSELDNKLIDLRQQM